MGAEYFLKRRHTSLKSIRSAEERETAVANVYAASRFGQTTVVILDDFATRGATLNSIAGALRQQNSALEIYGAVLAKNETMEWSSRYGQPVSNEHVPARVQRAWDGAAMET